MYKKDFTHYVTKYFTDYLPNHTGYSKNTIVSYKYTFLVFIEYLEKVKRIKGNNITFQILDSTLIQDFLLWLETDKNSSVSTRNQRLATLKAFFKYVQFETPEYLVNCLDIRELKKVKTPKKDIGYLSVEAIKILMKQPNIKEKEGLRHLAILSLLYDSGSRVQEIADLKVANITLNNQPTITVTGKGTKTRKNPITNSVAKILSQYIKLYELDNKPTEHLFRNKQGNQLTRAGITYILDKYIQKAKLDNPNIFNAQVSPHVMRHSKAMHMLEAGINLIYIRDFLGHVSVSTTEVYAKANPEVRRKELEKVAHNVVGNGKYSQRNKNDLIKLLKNKL